MKETGTAYLAWLFGLHSLYLGRPGRWIVYCMTFGGLGLWCLVDLFRMQQLVDEANQKEAIRRARMGLNPVQVVLYGAKGVEDEG